VVCIWQTDTGVEITKRKRTRRTDGYIRLLKHCEGTAVRSGRATRCMAVEVRP
jgi:hypothetical protein